MSSKVYMRYNRGIKKFLLPSIALHVIILGLALFLYNKNFRTHSSTPYEVRFIKLDNNIKSTLKPDKRETADYNLENVKQKKIEDISNDKQVNKITSYQENARTDAKGKNHNIEANKNLASNSLFVDTVIQDVGSARNSREKAYPNYRINPKPVYPLIARRRGHEGTVILRVRVLENGKVDKADIQKSSHHEILDRTALNAVNDWTFIPAKEDGVSVSSWVTVPIIFELKD